MSELEEDWKLITAEEASEFIRNAGVRLNCFLREVDREIRMAMAAYENTVIIDVSDPWESALDDVAMRVRAEGFEVTVWGDGNDMQRTRLVVSWPK